MNNLNFVWLCDCQRGGTSTSLSNTKKQAREHLQTHAHERIPNKVYIDERDGKKRHWTIKN